MTFRIDPYHVIKRTSGLIFLIGICINFSFAQVSVWTPAYTNISVNDGLPSSETYYVHQDRKGYMWFCTDHGVVKYDGFRMQVFDKTNGLTDDVIFKIYEDELGRIWFYAYNGTLAYYNPKENQIIPYKYNHLLAKLNHGDFNIKKDFVVDKGGNVYYAGVYEVGKIDPNGRLSNISSTSDRSFTEVHRTWLYGAAFDLEFLVSKKIHLFSANGKKSIYTYFEPFRLCDMIKVNHHDYLIVNNWLMDSDNLENKINIEGFTGMFDVDGELWVSTMEGAYHYKKQAELDLTKPDGHYLKNQKVTSVTKDREGGYWFTTLDDGIYYTPNLEILHCFPGIAKNQNNIYGLNGFGNNVFYASAFGYYDLKSGIRILKKNTGSNAIGIWGNQLILSNDLVNYNKGQLNRKSWGYELDQFVGWSVDSKGDFYAVYTVLTKLDKQTKKIETIIGGEEVYTSTKYKPHFFRHLVHDDQGNLYAGSSLGLYSVKKGKYEKVKLPPDLNKITITGLAFHKDWGTVVATKGKGLFFLRGGKVVRRIQLDDGLLSNQINTLYIDKNGKVYVGTNKGVSRIVKSEPHSTEIFNLTKLTGLSSSEVSSVYVNDEGTYIGTRNGITLVPNSYMWNKYSPEKHFQIKTVFLNGKPLKSFKNGMQFNASQKVIRFLLQTTNYKSLHEQPYKYRFRSTDPWSVGYNGEIILINPSFESYALEIRYKNELGVWSAPYMLLHFSISPPFYSTLWFTLLVFALAFSMVFLFFRNRLRTIQHRNKVQRNMELLEQKALLAQMNPHFIFNALNSIQSFLLYNENELAERYLLKLSKLIRLTLTNSRETEITIQKEIDSLQMYLELEQMRFKNRFEFRFEISLTKEELNKVIPPMLIQPFAENVIIHGFKGLEKGGEITLNFKQIYGNKLIVVITDNGVGYSSKKTNVEESGHKSYGTQITSERLNLFTERYQSEFDFSIESLKDESGNLNGTRVTVLIPIFTKQ